MMKTAIITVAGISSRFNEGIPVDEKELKAIYTAGDGTQTLLYHLLEKCAFADRIVVVGGYKYDRLKRYCGSLRAELKEKITLVRNERFADLGSGYSLYLGLEEAFRSDPGEILFVEGDLDIDAASFAEVVRSPGNVLTYTTEPIFASKAVVLYQDGSGAYRYAFNSSHGLLSIDEPFSCILNSGQVWKFADTDALKRATRKFYLETRDGTNLVIIGNYLDLVGNADLVCLRRWTNCNTREDYRRIITYWEEER